MTNQPDSLIIGIDVGASKIAAALVTNTGQVLANRQTKTMAEQGVQAVLDRIAGLANDLAYQSTNDLQTSHLPLLGVGIGIPGRIEASSGIVRNAVNLGWDKVHLVEGIRERLDSELRIEVDTDTNAGALGEFHFGAAVGCRDFVYMSIGSGLGAGIISNGTLVTGATSKAAELGHLSLDREGLPCVCGMRGCAETIVSGPGLINLVTTALAQGYNLSQLRGIGEITPRAIVSAAHQGDELASSAVSKMGRHLGTVIAICASVLNPGMVVIGGGLGIGAFDLIIPSAWEEIKGRTLPSVHCNLIITPAKGASSAAGPASLLLSHELIPLYNLIQ